MANGVTRAPGGRIFASNDFGTGVDLVQNGRGASSTGRRSRARTAWSSTGPSGTCSSTRPSRRPDDPADSARRPARQALVHGARGAGGVPRRAHAGRPTTPSTPPPTAPATSGGSRAPTSGCVLMDGHADRPQRPRLRARPRPLPQAQPLRDDLRRAVARIAPRALSERPPASDPPLACRHGFEASDIRRRSADRGRRPGRGPDDDQDRDRQPRRRRWSRSGRSPRRAPTSSASRCRARRTPTPCGRSSRNRRSR